MLICNVFLVQKHFSVCVGLQKRKMGNISLRWLCMMVTCAELHPGLLCERQQQDGNTMWAVWSRQTSQQFNPELVWSVWAHRAEPCVQRHQHPEQLQTQQPQRSFSIKTVQLVKLSFLTTRYQLKYRGIYIFPHSFTFPLQRLPRGRSADEDIHFSGFPTSHPPVYVQILNLPIRTCAWKHWTFSKNI